MTLDRSTSSLGEPPASPSASRASELAWMMRVVISRSSFSRLLADYDLAGSSGRTSPASCRSTADGRLEPCLGRWWNSGTGSPTEFLTLSTSEFPSDGTACSLSRILETGDLLRRYFLSARACRGILRRAEKRGKKLPVQLQAALDMVADIETTSIRRTIL